MCHRKTDCVNRLKLVKFDYSKGGCEHTDMEGFACVAFASEGIITWMVGLAEDCGGGCYCELYRSKDDECPY